MAVVPRQAPQLHHRGKPRRRCASPIAAGNGEQHTPSPIAEQMHVLPKRNGGSSGEMMTWTTTRTTYGVVMSPQRTRGSL